MNNFNPYNNYNWNPGSYPYNPCGYNTFETPNYGIPNPTNNTQGDHVLAVNGIDGAKAAAKKPNSDYIFRDINKKGIVYVVVTDATGLATVESYKLQGPVVPDEVQAERDKWSDVNKRLSRLEKAVLKDDKSRQNLQ